LPIILDFASRSEGSSLCPLAVPDFWQISECLLHFLAVLVGLKDFMQNLSEDECDKD